MVDLVAWQAGCVVDMPRWRWRWRWRRLVRKSSYFIILIVLASCAPPRRDIDSMVWSKENWNPQQEDLDYDGCSKWGEKAAFRKHFWQRSAIAREIENPTGKIDPGTLTDKLRRIAITEKISALELTEECMNALDYEFVPINKAKR